MAQQSMRGIRLGSQSMESEIGVDYFPRKTYRFKCGNGHLTEIALAKDAEVPISWQCRSCSLTAVLMQKGKRVELADDELRSPKSHFEMLMERRSKAELEELLKERISYIRARRKAGKADI